MFLLLVYLFYCAIPTIKFQVSSTDQCHFCHYQPGLLPAMFLVNRLSYFDLKTNKQKQNKSPKTKTHKTKNKNKKKSQDKYAKLYLTLQLSVITNSLWYYIMEYRKIHKQCIICKISWKKINRKLDE